MALNLDNFLTQDKHQEIHGYKVPPPFPVRPITALRRGFELVANKEDTSLVYGVTNALSGDAHVRKFKMFAQTEYGRKVLDTPIHIEKLLSDRNHLKSLPLGSVGRHYYEFMAEEGLSETALLNATKEAGVDYLGENNFPEFSRQVIHFKVTHDLWHVLTGYGRDGLGEICLLKFYMGQWYDRGIRLIVSLGALSMRTERPDLPVRDALKEADKNSRNAAWIMGEDVEKMLAEPLEEVRKRLRINPPTIYQAIPKSVRENLLAPRQTGTVAKIPAE